MAIISALEKSPGVFFFFLMTGIKSRQNGVILKSFLNRNPLSHCEHEQLINLIRPTVMLSNMHNTTAKFNNNRNKMTSKEPHGLQ